jgi:dTDP-4-amino-4,6-dideoxygalactose transaminase
MAGIQLLEFDDSLSTSYKNIVVELLDNWPIKRDETVAILNAENILARAYYSPPLHQKSMSYRHVPASLSTTDFLAQRFILLPCGSFVGCHDIDEIIKLIEFIYFHGADIAHRLSKIEAEIL